MIKPRNNPFAAHHLDSLAYRFSDLDMEALFQRIVAMNHRGAIVGPYGSGKTTLLNQLNGFLVERGYRSHLFFVNTDRPVLDFEQIKKMLEFRKKDAFILLDGADLLPRWQWWLLSLYSRKARGLVIACHRWDYLPILIHCQPTLNILDDILIELVGAEQRSVISRGRYLFELHGGNVREVLRDLYMDYADKSPIIFNRRVSAACQK